MNKARAVARNLGVTSHNATPTTRLLTAADQPALEALLMRAPTHNVFHLSALAEYGLSSTPDLYGATWGVGVFREQSLEGALVVQRGTGCIYHTPGDVDVLQTLASIVRSKGRSGPLSLLSGHASQIAPLLPLIQEIGTSKPDVCYFRTLSTRDFTPAGERLHGFSAPRQAGQEDIERLIDFYETGFYSLARLPSRAAWRSRLTEQIAFRSLYLVEDRRGRVASAALSSAEGRGAAMLGGVATLPEYVGRGLSTLCVGALCTHLFGKGLTSISLFYLQENHPADRVYTKLGFRNDGEWLLTALGYFGL